MRMCRLEMVPQNSLFNNDDIANSIDVDFSKLCLGLLTSVVWDNR